MRKLRAGFRRLGRGIGHFFTHWSVKKVILTVLAAGALYFVGSFAVSMLRAQAAVGAMARSSTRTTLLTQGDITESVTVTGTVESTGLANVTSSSSYKVTEILVQEGDTVVSGQVLAKLDTTELDKQISKAESSLTDGITSAQKTYNDALESYNEAYNSAVKQETTMNDAKCVMENAYVSYAAAANSISAYSTAYSAAYQNEQAAGTALNNSGLVAAQQALDAAQTNVNAAQAASDAANQAWVAAGSPSSGTEYDKKETAKAALATAQTAYSTAAANLQNVTAAQAVLLNNYSTAEAALTTATQNLNTAKANCNFDTIERAYTTAQTTYETARKMLDTLESTVKNAQKTLSNAQDALTKAKKSDTLEDLQEQLADCTITAATGGTITAVNCTVGSAPGGTAASGSGTAMFVIQDTDHLKVSVTVDEYDIKSVATGQHAVIKSDATGDTEISGTVSQISLTATTTQSTTGFGAEVTVDSTDSGLLIGMNAEVEIIISEKSGVYSVPYDAVGKDDAGNSVVYVKQSDGTFSPVQVTTGMETDYYIEISGSGLSDGLEIRSSADESSIDATSSAQSQAEQGAMAFNMGGGAMPSGGGGGGDMPSGGPQGGGPGQ